MTWRYFKLAQGDGSWPEDNPAQPGAIIRVRNLSQVPRSPVFNESIRCWVDPVWQEVADPAEVTQ